MYSYDELYHHGIKGQKWGVRKYQEADGSLTEEGRRHYGVGNARVGSIRYDLKRQKAYEKLSKRERAAEAHYNVLANKKNRAKYEDRTKEAYDNWIKENDILKKSLKDLDFSENEYQYRKARQEYLDGGRKYGIAGGAAGSIIYTQTGKAKNAESRWNEYRAKYMDEIKK